MKTRRARSASFPKKSFLFSGLPNEKRQILGKKIRQLGGIYHDSETFISSSTHIVCGKLSRSEKFLCGCATGKWILKPEYIEESYNCKQWLNEEQFEWCTDDGKTPEEREIASAPRKWRGMKLLTNENAFTGINAALLVEGNKRKTVYRRLLTCGGANMFILQLPIGNGEKINAVLQYIFADRSLADKHIPPSLHDYGIMSLSPEYIGDFLIKPTPPSPFDYFVMAPKGIPLSVKNCEDVHLCFSQESFRRNSPNFSSKTTNSSPCSSKTSSPLKILSQTSKKSTPEKIITTPSKPKSGKGKSKSPRSKLSPLPGQQPLGCFGFKSVKKENVKEMVPSLLSQEKKNLEVIQKATVQKKLIFTSNEFDENKNVTKNDETPSNCCLSTLSMPVKRRLSLDDQVEGSPRKKAKFGPIKSTWRPAFSIDLSNNIMNQEVSSQPRELSMSMSHIIEMYLEDGHLLSSLGLVSCIISSAFYLPASTMHSIMTKVLLFSSTEQVTNMCFNLLMKHLTLHPPTTQTLQDVYSQSFYSPDRDSTDNSTMWTFTSSLIRGALDELVKEEEKLFNHLVLLKYLLSLMEIDFQHLLTRLEKGESGKRISRSCLFINCMWSPGYLFFSNKNTRQLLLYYEECLTTPSTRLQKRELIGILSGYVNMAAQCFKMAESDWLVTTYQKPFIRSRTENFISELSQKILASHIQDCDILESVLNSLRPSWFCLGVSAYLLSAYNDYLLLKGMDDSPITLRKIVTQYFFLLPKLYSVRSADTLNTDVKHEADAKPRRRKNSPDVKDTNTTPVDNKDTISPVTVNNNHTPPLTDQFIRRINKKNIKGETPLHTACIKNDVRLVKRLLTVPGINVNAEDNYGWTPLHEACNHGNIECVELLLKYSPSRTLDNYFSPDSTCRKVDVLKGNVEGITPLHDSVITNRPEICQLLIKYGGTHILSSKTKTGMLPLDFAKTEEMRRLLSEDLEASSTQDSQSSLDSSRTDWLPTEYLYSEILTDGKTSVERKTSVSDCSRFLSLIRSLTLSYINAHDLKTFHDILVNRSMHKSTLPSNPVKQTDSKAANGDVNQRTNIKCLSDSLKISEEELEFSYHDVRILQRMKKYLSKFNDHLKRITTPEDYSLLLPKVHFLLCSLTTFL